MTINDAQALIRSGVKFGDVYPVLLHSAGTTSAVDELKEWFVNEPSVPVIKVNPQTDDEKAKLMRLAREKGYTGNLCDKCNSDQMVWSGACQKCLNCGETGGCS